MTKTFKLSLIFLITAINLVVCRIVFTYLTLSDNLSSWLFSGVFQVVAMGIIPYLMYRFMVNREFSVFSTDMRLKKTHPATYFIAIVVGLLVFLINNSISSVWYVFLNGVGYTYVSSVGTIYSSPEVLVFEILTTCMLPAIFEEFVDRGVLLAALDGGGMKDATKIIIVGIFFGFLHQNVTQLIPAMFGGMVMAYLAVKTKSIFPTMIVHFLNNFIITMYDYSSQKSGAFAGIYEAVYSTATSSYLAYFGMVLVSLVLLMLLLRICNVINKNYSKKAKKQSKDAQKQENPAIQGKPFDESGSVAGAGLYNMKGDLYLQNTVMPILAKIKYDAQKTEEKPTEQTAEAVGSAKTPKAKWWEFGLVIAAAVLTIIVTAFTFIWGVLR